MTVLEILETSWSELQKPGKWTQGSVAKDSSGRSVEVWSPEAVCFCSVGIIQKISPRKSDATRAILLLAKAFGKFHISIVEGNDRANDARELGVFWTDAISDARSQKI